MNPHGGNDRGQDRGLAGGHMKSEGGGTLSGTPFSGTVHEDGKVSMEHDGEKSEHPSIAHAAMHLHAKHEVGPAMHVHNHGGSPMGEHEGMEGHHSVTTHHVGPDGDVQGPHHHSSMEEAANHMHSAIGEGGGEGMHEGLPEHGGGGGEGKPSLY